MSGSGGEAPATARAEEVAGLRRGQRVCVDVFSGLCLIASLSGVSALTLCYLKLQAPALLFFKLDLAVLLFLAFCISV